MRSSRYGPPPRDDYLDGDPTIRDYEMSSEEYTGVYLMSQVLDKLPKCDFSQPLDDVYFKNGVIHSHWVVLFSCMPRDIGRLEAVSNRLGKYAVRIRNYDTRYLEDYL